VSYFDSAFIAKFYLDEPQSDAVRKLAEHLGRVHCAVFGRLEVAAVFHRKWREGEFSERAFREVSDQFTDDCAAGLWTWLPVTDDLIAAAAAAIRTLPKAVFLRSADALHLVCAREHGFGEIYTNDRQMLGAAGHFKLTPRDIS
jgi:predicted nucleic acid-binding protein